MSDYKSPFIDTPLGEYFETSPRGIAFPLHKKAVLDDHPSAEESGFHENHCGEFVNDFSENKTNFDKLVKDLSKNKNNLNFIFDWSNYGSQRYSYTPYRVSVKDIDFNRDVPKSEKTLHHTTFEYNLNGKAVNGSFNRARLNKRVCSLDSDRSHRITISPNKKKIDYVLSFYYSNTQKYRNPVKETIEDNDFSIEDKFRAIELYTDNVNHFVGFIELIDKRSTIRKSIEEAFKEAYKGINSDSALDWFYEKAPNYVIKNHKKEVLWNDLIKLLKFDERKWFIDSSNAMIKVLKGIASKSDGIEYLYDKFYANPITVKDIYHFWINLELLLFMVIYWFLIKLFSLHCLCK